MTPKAAGTCDGRGLPGRAVAAKSRRRTVRSRPAIGNAAALPPLACAVAQKDHAHRFEQNQHIQQQRVVLDVVDVVFELLDRVVDGGHVAMSDLRPTGNSRLDAMSHGIERNLFGQHRDEFRPFRTRAHQAHLAAKDVEDLGQLIQTGGSKKASTRDETGIKGIKLGHGGVLLHQLFEILFVRPRVGIYMHAPEFKDHE